MSAASAHFQHVAVVSHPDIPKAIEAAEEITAYLRQCGLESYHCSLENEQLSREVRDGVLDLLIVVGGDGTMLRAGHLCGPFEVPILGINQGHFGFLIEVRGEKWREVLPRMLAGECWLENRMMLCAELWRQDELLGTWDVLNEVAVSRGRIIRPVKLEASVDGRFLTTYVADGLIAATPTGSTAYAMAVGGPILPPELRNILLVPVAPHLSIDRAIVLAEGAWVSIVVRTDHEAVLSIDGQAPVELQNGDSIKAKAGEHSVHLVRFQDPGYFYRNLIPHMSQNPSTGNPR